MLPWLSPRGRYPCCYYWIEVEQYLNNDNFGLEKNVEIRYLPISRLVLGFDCLFQSTRKIPRTNSIPPMMLSMTAHRRFFRIIKNFWLNWCWIFRFNCNILGKIFYSRNKWSHILLLRSPPYRYFQTLRYDRWTANVVGFDFLSLVLSLCWQCIKMFENIGIKIPRSFYHAQK